MRSKTVATIAVLSALSIATNYAMISFYSVKLMDVIVFVAGFCFGPFVGAFTAIFSWAIYGTLNPLGFSLPIWISTMFAETIYGIGGGLVRRALNRDELAGIGKGRVNVCIFFGASGVFMTLFYDLLTNVVFGLVSGWNIVVAVIFGFVPFGIVHMVSNAFFFGVGCGPAIAAVLHFVGGESFVDSEE
jgi:uncharacterized membrane protein